MKSQVNMQTQTFTGPSELSDFAEICSKTLFAEVHYQFIFPKECSLQNWPVGKIKSTNEMFLKTLRHRANIYAIFIRSPGTDNKWNHIYVGQRKSVELRDRITQHLIKKSCETGSMLGNIKASVDEGKEIGLSFIKVEPETLRLFVEETIIAKHKKDLEWNTHG